MTTAERLKKMGLNGQQVFWNERGNIVCANCHIPYPGSDTWEWERQEITPEVMREIDRTGEKVSCERCGREPRRIQV